MDRREGSFVVLRCRACGDTFPSEEIDGMCPSCGHSDVEVATEPLL